MRNYFVWLGAVAVAVAGGWGAIHLIGYSGETQAAMLPAPPATSPARQRMARMIAETAARSAAQTAKALVLRHEAEAPRGGEVALIDSAAQ